MVVVMVGLVLLLLLLVVVRAHHTAHNPHLELFRRTGHHVKPAWWKPHAAMLASHASHAFNQCAGKMTMTDRQFFCFTTSVTGPEAAAASASRWQMAAKSQQEGGSSSRQLPRDSPFPLHGEPVCRWRCIFSHAFKSERHMEPAAWNAANCKLVASVATHVNKQPAMIQLSMRDAALHKQTLP
ncbi:MAG: hypothetical protein ACT6T3_21510 [Agrobacterium sp.]|uniref:hypothetical protein n=1 Tax=Agrobacterium sp. TaxID=361 RepID=UPI004033A69A